MSFLVEATALMVGCNELGICGIVELRNLYLEFALGTGCNLSFRNRVYRY